jgi:two-component system, cell cycle sensor histidine kinase and response regulator CckA
LNTRLPEIQPQAANTVDPTPEKSSFGKETVLLVDDEDSILELGRRILTKRGYNVLTAANGEEALDIYARENGKIALVVLDLSMPVMGGEDCLKNLLKINPQAKILISSGYSVDIPQDECINLGAKGFVSKPFGFEQLLSAVRNTLNE